MKNLRVNCPNAINAEMHWLSQMSGLDVKTVQLALLTKALAEKNKTLLVDEVKEHAKTVSSLIADEADKSSKAKK